MFHNPKRKGDLDRMINSACLKLKCIFKHNSLRTEFTFINQETSFKSPCQTQLGESQ